MSEAQWEPGRWWRVIAPDGSVWAETSSESEARERVRPGDTLQRLVRLPRRTLAGHLVRPVAGRHRDPPNRRRDHQPRATPIKEPHS